MSVVDEVKARLDIVDVVGGYVPLQKAGRYFKAPCPFHNEKTPSFIVYPDRQSWHCFGACGTGGDVIAFVSRKENLDFSATLRLLAERAGVELRNDGPRREEIKTLQDANEAAAVFYHGLLQNNATARAYIEERGLDKQTATDFLIGYAPAGWDGLHGHLRGKGFADAMLIEAGLMVEGERGPYDRFRDRIMFPIRDERGRVVGFGGRVLPDSNVARNDPGPKYLNTPQTPIFDKGGLLYGLDRARDDIRRSGTTVIVEGYMDVIAAHQHGFRNVVASMGTSLTDKQVLLCERSAKRTVIAMDADNAGSTASIRDVLVVLSKAQRDADLVSRDRRTVLERGLKSEWLVARVPEGYDPDELIRKDPDAWRAVIGGAEPILEHYYDVARNGRDMVNLQDRQEVINEMLPVIAELPSSQQAIWVQRLSRGSRAGEDELWRLIRGAKARRPATAARREPEATSEPTRLAARVEKAAVKEEFCLALLYREPALAHLAGRLDVEHFSLSENRELFRRWQAGEAVQEDEEGLWDHYQKVMATRIPMPETEQAEVAFLDCVGRMEQARMRAVKEASALALAEGLAGVRPGQVAAIARAKLEAGATEDTEDEAANIAADLFLEDNQNSLSLHRRLIESSRSDPTARPSVDP